MTRVELQPPARATAAPDSIIGNITRLEMAVRATIRGDLDDALRQEALDAARAMVRADPPLQDRELITLAGEIADLLSRKVKLSSWQALRLSDLTQSMRRLVERGRAAAAPAMVAKHPGEVGATGEEAGVVAVVAEDAATAATLQTALVALPAEVLRVDDLQRLRDALDNHAPEVVLLALAAPWEASLRTCGEVCATLAARKIPVIAVADVTDPAVIDRILQAGAVDLLRHPLVPAEMRARLRLHLRLVRFDAREANGLTLPAMTGSRPAATLLSPLLNLAHRQGQSVTMGLLGLGGDEPATWTSGVRLAIMRAVGQRLLPSFRSYDVVFQGGPDVFGLAMYGTRCADAAIRMAAILEDVCREPVVVSDTVSLPLRLCAGIAQYPHDGQDVEVVLQAAQQALTAARRLDPDERPIVLAGGPERSANGAEVVDVVLVDDDEPLASLLRHAVDVQGLSIRWLRDGESAYEMLGGVAPRLKARVVLLEADLAGLSGLALLRRLAQDGVLVETHVITLTARTDEAEQLALLELGAHDHVAKPASVPLLLQRVRHALRR